MLTVPQGKGTRLLLALVNKQTEVHALQFFFYNKLFFSGSCSFFIEVFFYNKLFFSGSCSFLGEDCHTDKDMSLHCRTIPPGQLSDKSGDIKSNIRPTETRVLYAVMLRGT